MGNLAVEKTQEKQSLNKKNTIKEIVLIRLFLILLLILYHSFCPAGGIWETPENYTRNFTFYWWISRFTYYFLLETFVFISGWLYGVQIKRANTPVNINDTISKKLKRLILPSVIFSVIYLLIFNGLDFSLTWLDDVLNGVGHMWFLPMLFWVFLISSVIGAFKFDTKVVLLISLSLVVLNYYPLPFRLSAAFYYLFFFYCGIILGKCGIERFKTLRALQSNGLYIILLALFSFALFATIVYYTNIIYRAAPPSSSLLVRIALKLGFLYGKVLYSFTGVLLCLVVSSWLIRVRRINIPDWLVNVSKYCFGVYIYQQFILKFIYYKLHFIDSINFYILPWLGFIITLVVSILLAWLTLKTRFGRLLIG